MGIIIWSGTENHQISVWSCPSIARLFPRQVPGEGGAKCAVRANEFSFGALNELPTRNSRLITTFVSCSTILPKPNSLNSENSD